MKKKQILYHFIHGRRGKFSIWRTFEVGVCVLFGWNGRPIIEIGIKFLMNAWLLIVFGIPWSNWIGWSLIAPCRSWSPLFPRFLFRFIAFSDRYLSYRLRFFCALVSFGPYCLFISSIRPFSLDGSMKYGLGFSDYNWTKNSDFWDKIKTKTKKIHIL